MWSFYFLRSIVLFADEVYVFTKENVRRIMSM